MLTVDTLAQEIRRVDGNHSLGAGALAEALEALERENATLRAALEPFALAVERAEKAATAFGVSHRAEVPDNRDFGPLVVTWGDLRRAAAIRNMGGGE